MKNIASLLSRKSFFWVIIALFVVQSAWIALSGRYPMAFDEDFHLGIIRLFAQHWSPFWSAQPAGADVFGAVSRDPSYLYQWLMSFPYRLISTFTSDQTLQVLFLRAINIGIFAWALVLYRNLLLKFKSSRAQIHAVLLIFVLIPVVPLLAAQINYDSLFLAATAASLLLTVRLNQELTDYKRVNVRVLITLLSVGLLGSLIKFAYLPIFAAILGFIVYRCWRVYPTARKFLHSLVFGATLLTRRSQLVLAIVFVLSLGLFVERYGVNLMRYHEPIPDCGVVLSIEQCQQYGPWARDHTFELSKDHDSTAEKNSPVNFTVDWFYGMWMRSFFAVDGPSTQFQTRGPLVLPGIGAIALSASAFLAVIVTGKQIWRRYDKQALALSGVVTALYVALLWLQEHKAFVHTGHSVAINGRYLFPILPMVILVGVLGWSELLRRRPRAKVALLSLAILALICGGGALTYILRSNDAWYWPGSNPVKSINHGLQNTLGPITPGYRTPTQFLGNN